MRNIGLKAEKENGVLTSQQNYTMYGRYARGWLWSCEDLAGPLTCHIETTSHYTSGIPQRSFTAESCGCVGYGSPYQFSATSGGNCPYFTTTECYSNTGSGPCSEQQFSCTGCDGAVGAHIDADGVAHRQAAFDITDDGYYQCSVAHVPTTEPTGSPTTVPTTAPTLQPQSSPPTDLPTTSPSTSPTLSVPTITPTLAPSTAPSAGPATSSPSCQFLCGSV